MKPAYYKDLHDLANHINNIQTDWAYQASQAKPSERDHVYAQASRVYDRLKDCIALCEVLDAEQAESKTTQSLRRCLMAMVGGRYRLSPDSDPLCLGFTVAGMHGGFIWHWNAREWSLHT